MGAGSRRQIRSAQDPWGEPDLQGTWTGDDLHDVPFERPAQYRTRATLTEDELKKRSEDVNELLGSIDDGARRKVGYFGKAPAGVEAAAVPQKLGCSPQKFGPDDKKVH